MKPRCPICGKAFENLYGTYLYNVKFHHVCLEKLKARVDKFVKQVYDAKMQIYISKLKDGVPYEKLAD